MQFEFEYEIRAFGRKIFITEVLSTLPPKFYRQLKFLQKMQKKKMNGKMKFH